MAIKIKIRVKKICYPEKLGRRTKKAGSKMENEE